MYHQFTLFALEQILAHGVSASDLTVLETAYQSLKSGFEDYLAHYNDGRPIGLIGHSQGASLLVSLLGQVVDNDPALRSLPCPGHLARGERRRGRRFGEGGQLLPYTHVHVDG